MTLDLEGDVALLQGRWRQVSCEADGVRCPDDGLAGITTFSGHTFTVQSEDGTVLLTGTFSLNAAACPKAIDWTDTIGPDAGKTLPAIYVLEGDNFIFIAADEGAQRPTEFRTKGGETMRSFVRC